MVRVFCTLLLVSTLAQAETIQFPKNFRWCVSTAAHQIEGGNLKSDHYQWETTRVDRVISKELISNPEAERTLQNATNPLSLPRIACPTSQPFDPDYTHTVLFRNSQTGSVQQCEYSGRAIDHWNRVKEDVELIRKLNVKDYRFSVEWAKIEPAKGVFDQTALDHYADEIEQLIQNGITPQVTLFHFTMPQWLRDEGGWESENSIQYFSRFTQKVYSALGTKVAIWYTLNEPMVHLSAGYIAGVLPPGVKDPGRMLRALANMVKAHAVAYHELHAMAGQRKIFVGIAHHLRVFDPLLGSSYFDFATNQAARAGAYLADEVWNWLLIDLIESGHLTLQPTLVTVLNALGLPMKDTAQTLEHSRAVIRGTQDFLGVNYYTRDMVHFDLASGDFVHAISIILNPDARAHGRTTDMNWEIYPEGLYRVLKAASARVMKTSGRTLPILISENGIADRADSKRQSFLGDHLRWMKKAMDEGVQVRGYCHWSLTDNFEWNSGYYPRFGLYSIDYKTLARTARPSALWFSELARTNQFSYSK